MAATWPPTGHSIGRRKRSRAYATSTGSLSRSSTGAAAPWRAAAGRLRGPSAPSLRERCAAASRSEEHTSELQSPCNLVCRLLLEKKKIKNQRNSDQLLDEGQEERGHNHVMD